MSQGLRDMLANRRFAIPLIVLLAFCFVGLILVGIVLILRPGDNGDVAQATGTPVPEATARATSTPIPTEEPTQRPTPTLVPLGTSVSSGSGDQTPTTAATEEPTAAATQTPKATGTPITDEELADTGIGWGLVLISGIGLGMLAVAARRLRMA
ncbi:MAG: hypothetical protein ACK2UU_00130 [Anaerolineae bacterium]